ncbi:aldehyde dehydrogenase family protein [Halocatena pleomorpha]|uniref:Aldehyde dehydrogenase family protein n=1 Tax=Halocatena pleomorpha TaxID=1785090 RepID=A0A3P3R9S2_9EURY|nr:aldehyde dehydrogenase family protein [Halocatena pleomorpha]RRJ29430.1 aldehyde dehydrogenase family protein [Halocatena pleomorpha]
MSTDSQRSPESKSVIKQRHQEAADELVPSDPGQLYIGGEWRDSHSGDTLDTRDPTTGDVLTKVQAGGPVDIDRAVDAAWEAYDETWSNYSVTDRQELLHTIADRIESRAEDFATIETLDNGKPISEARLDINLVIDHFRYFAGACRVEEGRTVQSDPDHHIQTLREPYGVVGQIIPWNFPLLMAAWKLAPALAAGNAIILKPAEETPLSILELMREIDDILPAGVINVVTGYGPEAGAPLSNHDGVRKIAFTGSTEVGRSVMKNAADSITDITLELGGKSPLIVYPDADIETAAEVARVGMFHNTGECCCAGTRLFVHEDIRDEFLDAFIDEVTSLTLGDPLCEETTLGPKVTEEQVQRTLEYIEQARDSGADIVTGGGKPDEKALSDGCFVAPTVITDITHESRAVQEEIFGPVETVFEWSEYDEMIERANDVDYGLAAGVITADLQQAHNTARDIEAGNIWVNTYNEFPAGQPFGGYKQSGIGRETAAETLEHYTQTKTINFDLN